MTSLKDIMDVDVEPLDAQAYRRSREAAKLLPPILSSTEIVLPPILLDTSTGAIPQRRKSSRTLRPAIYSTSQGESQGRRHSSATEDVMDYSIGYQMGMGMGDSSKSGSPSRSSRGSENPDGVPVKYTPITGRVSKAKKGVPVHTCEQCRPVKTFTRAEHLRRHQLSHQKPAYPCTFEDCERAFHRPDLLARHMHRHETQGEKAYKSEGPRSRASSDASEGQPPSLKVEPPSQLPLMTLGSPMTPRTSGSGDSATTTSSYSSTIRGNFSNSGFFSDAGISHKRSASEAQLTSPVYSAPSQSPGRPGTSGSFEMNTNQNAFTSPGQQLFEEPFSLTSAVQFPNYTTTPQLPLLRIPEETWVPGLASYNSSPWCSSASDSTFSARSEGPRRYGRSGSISTLPDWSATGSAPQWSPNPMSGTPQDMRNTPFDQILEQYDTSYVSPRITPDIRSQHLDVPSAYGGAFTFMESVGTPTLATFSKPVAQRFPVSPSRISSPAGLDLRQGLVEPQLASHAFAVSTVQPQFEIYIASYWRCFHQDFPLIHKPTFSTSSSQLLNHAVIAIGTQFHQTPEGRTTGDIMNSACKKAIACCPNWDLPTKQAILLTEMFNRYRGKRINVKLSRDFEELYSRLLSESTQKYLTPIIVRSQSMPNTGYTAESLLERFSSQNSIQNISEPNTENDWYSFLQTESRRRLLSLCFMFDVHQSMFHQQPRSKAIRDNSRPLMHFPCPEDLWDASSAIEWKALNGDSYILQALHPIESEITSTCILSTPPFTQRLLMSWYAAQLPLRQDQHYPNSFPSPELEKFMTLFPTSSHAQTYLSLYHTPLHSLLAIAGDTWVFAKKITPPSAFHAAQACLKIWSTTLAAAQATHHACRVLQAALSQPADAERDSGLSDYWSLYVCSLTCWAFGNRFQNSGSNASQLNSSGSSTSASSTPVDEMPVSAAEETRVKALVYVDAMLGFSVEELLTGKAYVKAETQAVIEAVRFRLEEESVGGRSGALVDAVLVLGKIRDGGRGKWF